MNYKLHDFAQPEPDCVVEHCVLDSRREHRNCISRQVATYKLHACWLGASNAQLPASRRKSSQEDAIWTSSTTHCCTSMACEGVGRQTRRRHWSYGLEALLMTWLEA